MFSFFERTLTETRSLNRVSLPPKAARETRARLKKHRERLLYWRDQTLAHLSSITSFLRPATPGTDGASRAFANASKRWIAKAGRRALYRAISSSDSNNTQCTATCKRWARSELHENTMKNLTPPQNNSVIGSPLLFPKEQLANTTPHKLTWLLLNKTGNKVSTDRPFGVRTSSFTIRERADERWKTENNESDQEKKNNPIKHSSACCFRRITGRRRTFAGYQNETYVLRLAAKLDLPALVC